MRALNGGRALVIGGSLSGHFAAAALRAIGWQADIFERSGSELDGRGGGIALQPEVLEAFRFCHIALPGELGVRCTETIFLDRSDHILQRTPADHVLTSWNMIYKVLKDACPLQDLHHGEELVDAEVKADHIEARFSGGRCETGDMLIGADGPRSRVRQLILPNLSPSYAGYVAWRGLVPEKIGEYSGSLLLRARLLFQRGPAHQVLAYLIPGENGSTLIGERRWNWVWYRKVDLGEGYSSLFTDRYGTMHSYSLPPDTVQPRHEEEMRRAACELLAPTFQAIIGSTQSPFVQAILDLEVPQMVFGRLVLLGDAAFVPRPHAFGGTAKAAMNAVSFANALQATSNPQASLTNWNTQQVQAGRDMNMRGVTIGRGIMST